MDEVDTFKEEIKTLKAEIKKLNTADTFRSSLVATPWATEGDLFVNMDIGEVLSVIGYGELSRKYAVKINEHRIDEYDDRITAEGVAMLHRKY